MRCVRAWGVLGSIWLWILAGGWAKIGVGTRRDTHFALMEGFRRGGTDGPWGFAHCIIATCGGWLLRVYSFGRYVSSRIGIGDSSTGEETCRFHFAPFEVLGRRYWRLSLRAAAEELMSRTVTLSDDLLVLASLSSPWMLLALEKEKALRVNARLSLDDSLTMG